MRQAAATSAVMRQAAATSVVMRQAAARHAAGQYILRVYTGNDSVVAQVAPDFGLNTISCLWVQCL